MHANSQVFQAALEQLSGLVQRERGALVAVAVREGLTREEALESVQEALLTFLRRAQGAAAAEVDGEERAPAAVLKLMVRNAARNVRRRHHRLKPHLPIDEHDPGSADDAERLLGLAETALQLQSCVAELRELERAVVTLRLLEERSGEDVAQLLGLSRAHVDVLVYRAKATLRVCMGAVHCSGRYEAT